MKKIKCIAVLSLFSLLTACNMNNHAIVNTNSQQKQESMPKVEQRQLNASVYDVTIITKQSETQDVISDKINKILESTNQKDANYNTLLNNLESIGSTKSNGTFDTVTLIDSQFDVDTSVRTYPIRKESGDKLLLKESGIGVVVKILKNPDINKVGIIASSSKGAALDIKNLENNTTNYKNEINLNNLYPIAIYKENSNKYRVLFIEVNEAGTVKTLSLK